MAVHYSDAQITLHHGDALEIARELPDGAADCIVTSPPYYGLRDYGVDGQYGLESTPAEYVDNMRVLFGELRRVLADDGTLWLNIGDSYSAAGGHTDPGQTSQLQGRRVQLMQNIPSKGADRPRKSLLGIPWRVAFALQDDGWILRNAIIWHKTNAMPESVRDRLPSRYEHVFLFSKSRQYWFDLDAVREPAPDVGLKTPGDVWTMPTTPFSEAHFAVYPPALPIRCILAGCKPGGVVLDPFSGSGTTGLAAQRTGHRYIGIDISAAYLDLSLRTRLHAAALDFEAGA
jgi:DNA modification methylase